MKILVTGGGGMVGQAIRRMAKSHSHHEYVFSSRKIVDFTDPKSTFDYIQYINPQMVIHLAADVGGLYKNMNQSISMFENNILININVLKACYDIGVQKCISVLSTCIFPDKLRILTEDNIHDGPPHPSNEGYAYAKRMLEVQSRLYRSLGRDYSCVIPCNLYGSYDCFDIQKGHVVPSLIKKAIESVYFNKPFIVFGSGSSLRQFLYVDDFATILLSLCETKSENPNIIICPKEEISIKELVQVITNILQVNDVIYDTSYADGQYQKYAKSSIDYHYTPIEEGIQKTIEWYQKHMI